VGLDWPPEHGASAIVFDRTIFKKKGFGIFARGRGKIQGLRDIVPDGTVDMDRDLITLR